MRRVLDLGLARSMARCGHLGPRMQRGNPNAIVRAAAERPRKSSLLSRRPRRRPRVHVRGVRRPMDQARCHARGPCIHGHSAATLAVPPHQRGTFAPASAFDSRLGESIKGTLHRPDVIRSLPSSTASQPTNAQVFTHTLRVNSTTPPLEMAPRCAPGFPCCNHASVHVRPCTPSRLPCKRAAVAGVHTYIYRGRCLLKLPFFVPKTALAIHTPAWHSMRSSPMHTRFGYTACALTRAGSSERTRSSQSCTRVPAPYPCMTTFDPSMSSGIAAHRRRQTPTFCNGNIVTRTRTPCSLRGSGVNWMPAS